jgi:hypothetical protein
VKYDEDEKGCHLPGTCPFFLPLQTSIPYTGRNVCIML